MSPMYVEALQLLEQIAEEDEVGQLKAIIAIATGRLASRAGGGVAHKTLANISTALLRQCAIHELTEHVPLAKPVAAIMREITQEVAEQTGFTVEDLRGFRKAKELSEARWAAWTRIYATGRVSYSTIGRFFGDRDHTSILYGVRKYAARVAA